MKRKDGEFEVGPSWLLQQKYGLYAENRPAIVIDPSQVPEHLRLLIPMAERWGIGCDITRLDYIHRQPREDVRTFYASVLPLRPAIDTWLDSLPDDTAQWPDAAVYFLYLAIAHDDAYEPTEAETRLRDQRWETETRPRRLERASLSAADALRERQFTQVVELLTPFEPYLGRSDLAKLAYAKKHLPQQ
jgi:hypothetical protein